MAQRYEKAKRQGDFDGDHVASTVAHMINLGATLIAIDLTGGTVAITSNAKMPDGQAEHLEIVDKGTVPDIVAPVAAAEAEEVKP
jgi:hypothetical protein